MLSTPFITYYLLLKFPMVKCIHISSQLAKIHNMCTINIHSLTYLFTYGRDFIPYGVSKKF